MLGGAPLGADDASHRVQKVLVLQHHLVDLKDGGVVLPHLPYGALIERPQLGLGPGAGLLKPLQLLSVLGKAGDGLGLDLRF